jgi:hypothetical protein
MRTTVIELEGKRLFVLNGLLADEEDWESAELIQLIQAAKKDPDAVAFGRVAGKWVAAA